LNSKQTIRGIATVSFYASDIEAAKNWNMLDTEVIPTEELDARKPHVRICAGVTE
jgi:hypothetical protein